MKKKYLILGLSLLLTSSILVGCTNNKDGNNMANGHSAVEEKNNNLNDGYYDLYTTNYNASILPLSDYNMYSDIGQVEDYYKNNNYPGNEKYLEEVKTALRESRDNVKTFITTMKKEAKTENKEVERLNREMIDKGEDLVEDINDRLEDLNEITDRDLQRPEKDFRQLVNDRIMLEEGDDNNFRGILKDLEHELNIDRPNKSKS